MKKVATIQKACFGKKKKEKTWAELSEAMDKESDKSEHNLSNVRGFREFFFAKEFAKEDHLAKPAAKKKAKKDKKVDKKKEEKKKSEKSDSGTGSGDDEDGEDEAAK